MSSLRSFRFLWSLLWVVIAIGCTTQPKIVNPGVSDGVSEWRNDKAYFFDAALRFSEIQSWKYSAKIGIRTETIRESANVVWRMSHPDNDVRLFGPLGMGAVHLKFDEKGAELKDGDGTTYRGRSAQQLLNDVVGWPLPVDALSRWLFIHPDLNHVFWYRLNREGLVDSIRQHGWQIDYRDYRQYEDKLLPRKVIAQKRFEDESLGFVSIKLITKDWHWQVAQ